MGIFPELIRTDVSIGTGRTETRVSSSQGLGICNAESRGHCKHQKHWVLVDKVWDFRFQNRDFAKYDADIMDIFADMG